MPPSSSNFSKFIGQAAEYIPAEAKPNNVTSSKPTDGEPSSSERSKYGFLGQNDHTDDPPGEAASRGKKVIAASAVEAFLSAVFFHSVWWRRVSAPVLIVLIASLILISQLQLAFATRYQYEYDLEDLKDGGEGETYAYNLWLGATELWEGGAPLLAVIVVMWSGIFPYVKLLLMGFVDVMSWSSPTVQISPRWAVLSVLAKWSFLDIWVVALTILCIRIDIDKHQTMHSWVFTRDLYLKIWTQAVALPGCFFFAFALVCSQFLGHFVIQRARQCGAPKNSQASDPACIEKPLLHRVEDGQGSNVITVCSIVSFAGLYIGLLSPFLHLEYHLNIDIHQQFLIDEHVSAEIIETYNVFSAAGKCAMPNHIGAENLGISLLMLAFVAAAPLVRSACCILLWFVPLRDDFQRALAQTIELTSVVAAAEVFGVAALVMTWQLPMLFENMEEAAEYIYLELTPCIGMFILTPMGFLDTYVSGVIHAQYIEVLKIEQQKLNSEAPSPQNGENAEMENPLKGEVQDTSQTPPLDESPV
eukprot:CAMPEP_0172649880 /NCGR_PEP_ID=MMETSP1068-20121228/242014_1 /TAXON_ID=35684 /ORGANISM="Pseudopedinella elastica, Strain CCMP716" /LENGTH=530 /DNA_ID=CAMNT_0013464241 /DNA_START=78 /DNA_END=1670 /DNA_ORIENTATION=-